MTKKKLIIIDIDDIILDKTGKKNNNLLKALSCITITYKLEHTKIILFSEKNINSTKDYLLEKIISTNSVNHSSTLLGNSEKLYPVLITQLKNIIEEHLKIDNTLAIATPYDSILDNREEKNTRTIGYFYETYLKSIESKIIEYEKSQMKNKNLNDEGAMAMQQAFYLSKHAIIHKQIDYINRFLLKQSSSDNNKHTSISDNKTKIIQEIKETHKEFKCYIFHSNSKNYDFLVNTLGITPIIIDTNNPKSHASIYNQFSREYHFILIADEFKKYIKTCNHIFLLTNAINNSKGIHRIEHANKKNRILSLLKNKVIGDKESFYCFIFQLIRLLSHNTGIKSRLFFGSPTTSMNYLSGYIKKVLTAFASEVKSKSKTGAKEMLENVINAKPVNGNIKFSIFHRNNEYQVSIKSYQNFQ